MQCTREHARTGGNKAPACQPASLQTHGLLQRWETVMRIHMHVHVSVAVAVLQIQIQIVGLDTGFACSTQGAASGVLDADPSSCYILASHVWLVSNQRLHGSQRHVRPKRGALPALRLARGLGAAALVFFFVCVCVCHCCLGIVVTRAPQPACKETVCAR